MSFNQKLIAHNKQVAKRGKVKGQLALEQMFGYFWTFKKTTKILGFYWYLKTTGLQDIIYTTTGIDIKITNNVLFPFIPTLTPDPETQVKINQSIKINIILPFDSSTSDTKTVITGLDYPLDIRSSSKNKSPKNF